MLQLFGRSIRDFRASYKKHLLFEYLFMLLTSFVFVPIMSYLFNRIIRMVGSGFVLNDEVYKVGLSYTGIIGLIAIGLAAVIVLFIEFGVIITIAQKYYFGKEVLISDAVVTTLRKTPKIFGFGIIQLLFFLLFLVPFIDSPLSSSFYAFFNVPIFFNTRILDTSVFRLVLYAIAFLAAVYTILRWIFVLHYIIIEGKSIRAAIKSSLSLTKGKRLSIFVNLFLLNTFIVSLGFVTLSSVAYFPSWLDINVLKAISDRHSLTITTVLTYMFTLLLVPVNIIFLTRLFYHFNQRRGLMPEDKLRIYRSRWFGPLEERVGAIFKHKTNKRLLYSMIVTVYLVLALLVSYAASDNLVYVKWNVLLSSHRGDTREAPENSLRAVRAAIENGVDAVEIDAQLTKDGVVVLHHDYNLRRMAGLQMRVKDLTFDELTMVNIGSRLNKSVEPERIPMLAEALYEAKGKAKLIIDLKSYGPGEELARKVVKLIEDFDMVEECYIQSLDRESLKQVRQLNPEIKIGQILYFAIGDLSLLDVDYYTVEQAILTRQLIERAHKNGREVWVWTVNSERNLKEVLKFDIDGIITDYPARAQNMVELDL
ncbi:MAG: glycerophosphoryl diester phosphodiesterase membrane domain-containing protein [Bacillota bacterium]